MSENLGSANKLKLMKNHVYIIQCSDTSLQLLIDLIFEFPHFIFQCPPSSYLDLIAPF